jgi:hypothetical protein
MKSNPNDLNCAACEALLMDALDGALTPDLQLAFDRHVASCDGCRRMVADAQRGAAWLEMLKADRPEPPAGLMHRILSQTSGMQTSITPAALPQLVPQPVPAGRGNLLAFPRRWSAATQTRLAMTAAMAFFSVALTANVLGLSFGSLRPGNLERGLYQAQARLIQYYDNLGVVAQLQSRVHDIERISSEDSEQPAPDHQPQPDQQSKPSGTSHRESAPAGATQAIQHRPLLPADSPTTLQGVQA